MWGLHSHGISMACRNRNGLRFVLLIAFLPCLIYRFLILFSGIFICLDLSILSSCLIGWNNDISPNHSLVQACVDCTHCSLQSNLLRCNEKRAMLNTVFRLSADLEWTGAPPLYLQASGLDIVLMTSHILNSACLVNNGRDSVKVKHFKYCWFTGRVSNLFYWTYWNGKSASLWLNHTQCLQFW